MAEDTDGTQQEFATPDRVAPKTTDTQGVDAVPVCEPVDAADPMTELAAQLEKERATSKEYLELAQRTRADLENYRKRVQRDRDLERNLVVADFIRELLNPLHDLERALVASETKPDFDALKNGLCMIQAEIRKVMEKRKVARIPTVGHVFDPNVHEALMQVPSAAHPAHTIVDEVAPGFIMGELCLRPAKVVVSSGAAEEPSTGEAKGE